MFKDFFLAPGRYLCLKFSGNKRKFRFAPRQVVRGPVGLISVIIWAMVVSASVYGVVKFASPPTPTYNQAQAEETAQVASAQVAPTSDASAAGAVVPGQATTASPSAAAGASLSVPTGANTTGAAGTPSNPASGSSAQSATTPTPSPMANAGQELSGSASPRAEGTLSQPITAEAWLVIVESIPKNKRIEAEQSLARHTKRGLNLEIVDTDAYPRLKGGMWTLAAGPFDSQQEALVAAAEIKPKVKDLMVRRGL